MVSRDNTGLGRAANEHTRMLPRKSQLWRNDRYCDYSPHQSHIEDRSTRRILPWRYDCDKFVW